MDGTNPRQSAPLGMDPPIPTGAVVFFEGTLLYM